MTAVLYLTFKAKEINEIGFFHKEIKRSERSTISYTVAVITRDALFILQLNNEINVSLTAEVCQIKMRNVHFINIVFRIGVFIALLCLRV